MIQKINNSYTLNAVNLVNEKILNVRYHVSRPFEQRSNRDIVKAQKELNELYNAILFIDDKRDKTENINKIDKIRDIYCEYNPLDDECIFVDLKKK